MQMYSNEYRIDRPRRAFRNSLLLFTVLLAVVVLVLTIYYITKINRATTDESREVRFTVSRGQSTTEIANKLVDQKVIGNKVIFLIYTRLSGAGNKIQAGDYDLNSNMTMVEIVDVLTSGKVIGDSRNVTIIEGWSNSQIGKNLTSRGITTSESELERVLSEGDFDFKFKTFADKFEYQGFLFPDTYTISSDASVSVLVEKMLQNFETKITDQMVADINSRDYDLGQILTLASIIEKEVGRNTENITSEDLTKLQEERKLVASVFYNRLEIGMALESDATVNYVTGKSDRSVTFEDTKIRSPYNTYQVRGLPPTPIGNPGLNSIMAAIYPAESDYLYFLNSPDGTAYFGRTLQEHNENRQKYLR